VKWEELNDPVENLRAGELLANCSLEKAALSVKVDLSMRGKFLGKRE
jgi:hypothetical protein